MQAEPHPAWFACSPRTPHGRWCCQAPWPPQATGAQAACQHLHPQRPQQRGWMPRECRCHQPPLPVLLAAARGAPGGQWAPPQHPAAHGRWWWRLQRRPSPLPPSPPPGYPRRRSPQQQPRLRRRPQRRAAVVGAAEAAPAGHPPCCPEAPAGRVALPECPRTPPLPPRQTAHRLPSGHHHSPRRRRCCPCATPPPAAACPAGSAAGRPGAGPHLQHAADTRGWEEGELHP